MRYDHSNQMAAGVSRPLSNAVERSRAIRFATSLVLILMVLAAAGGYLFPYSQYLMGKDNVSNKSAMEKHLYEDGKLGQSLAGFSAKYHKIDSLDGVWMRSAPLSLERSTLKNTIRPLEDDLSLKVGRFKQEHSGEIAQTAALAYDYLLASRGLLWTLREEKTPVQPPVDPMLLLQHLKASGNLDECEKNARTVAAEVDKKTIEMDTVIKRIKGWGDRNDKIDLERLVKEFENLARRLRDTP